MKEKQFVYLYPISEYFNSSIGHNLNSDPKGPDSFRSRYKAVLNEAIDLRYRQQGFGINYVIFDGHGLSDIIEIQSDDKIIEAGVDFKTHCALQPNGEHIYPDPGYILEQIPQPQILRIAGFHLWDCVEKLAIRAHKRNLDVLIDEDLTEIFSGWFTNPDFAVNQFPSYNPRKYGKGLFELFMRNRKDRPWIWQNY